MAEFEAGGDRYRTRAMCAAEQWFFLEKLRPILPALAGLDHGLRVADVTFKGISSTLAPLLSAPDEDVDAVFKTVLGVCERQDEGAWRLVDRPPPLATLMRLTTQVVSENFGALFAMERPSFRPTQGDRLMFDAVRMPGSKDWLLRPVLRKLCKIESLYDGTLRIEHLVDLNDALDVEDENAARAQKAAEKKK